MKNLLEISKLVSKKRVKKIEIFDEYNLSVKNSKFNEFYEALQNGLFQSDKDAAEHLYQCEATDDRYRQLKSRFRKRLLNTLFFLDVNTPDASNYSRAYFSCQREWAVVKILEINGAMDSAETIARQIFVTAQKFQFADVMLDSARILRQFAADNGRAKEYEEYDSQLKIYKDILEAEIRSEEFYQRARLSYSQGEEANLRAHIDTFCDALMSLNGMYQSSVIQYNTLLMQSIRAVMMRQFQNVIGLAQEAETYMKTYPNFYRQDISDILESGKMNAYLHLREYRNGKTAYEKLMSVNEEGTGFWFNVNHYYFLLCMHTENYIPAAGILNKVLTNAFFKKLKKDIKEFWLLSEGYINLMIEIYGAESVTLRRQTRRIFKWSEFLAHDVDAKTEPTLYAQRALIKLMHCVETKKLVLVSGIIDDLKNELPKNLKSDISARFIIFLRLLQAFEKVSFKPTEINTDKFIYKLQQTPFLYQENLAELEIIRFEVLWKIINLRLK